MSIIKANKYENITTTAGGFSIDNTGDVDFTGDVTFSGAVDFGDFSGRIITLDNLEKSNLSADGQLSFDSSQGLLVYRTQQGVSGNAVTVLDGANVQAGTNLSISNLGGGDAGTGRITFSTINNPTFSTSVTSPLFTVTNGGTIRDVTGSYGSVKVTGGSTGGWKGWAIETGAVFMQNDAGTQFGLYDDSNNHWALRHNKNGATELYYDGGSKIQTESGGINVSGNITLSHELNMTGGGDGNRVIDCRLGSGALYIRGTSGGDTNHETLMTLQRNGPVALFHNNISCCYTGNISGVGYGLIIQGGLLQIGNAYSTSSTPSPNIRMTNIGYIQKIESKRATKRNIDNITDEQATNFIQNARPITYHAVEQTDDELRNYGFIAEEMHEVDHMLTEYDDNGVPQSVHYGCIPTVLTKVAQLHDSRISRLEFDVHQVTVSASAATTNVQNMQAEVFEHNERIERLEEAETMNSAEQLQAALNRIAVLELQVSQLLNQ